MRVYRLSGGDIGLRSHNELSGITQKQALGGAYPGDVYTPSTRVYEPPPEPEYPYQNRTVRVKRCGRICRGKRKINLLSMFTDQMVGTREVDDQI